MAKKNPRKKSQHLETKPKIKLWVFPLFLLIIIGGIFIYFTTEVKHIQDDAYITFRYVDNFIHGNGLVFNEGEQVEGFTSILWVLLLSCLALLKSDLPVVSQYMSIAGGLLTLFITYKLSELIIGSPNNIDLGNNEPSKNLFESIIQLMLKLSPSVLLTFTGAFIYWSVSGMETTFFVLINLSALYFYILEKDKPYLSFKFSALMLLGTFTRPEGALMFVLILLHFFSYKYLLNKKQKLSHFLKSLLNIKNLQSLAIVIIPNVLLVIFRLVYYGYPFPNTFYAKAGISSIYFAAGIEYFIDFTKAYMLYGIIWLAPLLLFRFKQKFLLSLFYLIIVVNTFYIVLVGGDVLPFYRFFLPILPLLYILFIALLVEMYSFVKSRSTAIITKSFGVVLLIIVGLTSYHNYTYSHSQIKRLSFLENELVSKMKGSAEWLNKQQLLMKKQLTVAATTIGALSYYSDAIIIDMLGLTDEEIAHNPKYIAEISGIHAGWKERKYNVDYVLSRDPDFIFFSTGIKPSAYAERALFINEKFINYYYPYFFKIWPNKKFVETIYRKRFDKRIFVGFSENPKYDDKYVHNYHKVLNMKGDTTEMDKIINICYELIEQAPLNFADSYRVLASAYDRSGDKQKALEYYKKAFDIDDTNGPANIAMFLHYRSLGDTLNMIKHYTYMKRYNPTILSLYGMN